MDEARSLINEMCASTKSLADFEGVALELVVSGATSHAVHLPVHDTKTRWYSTFIC